MDLELFIVLTIIGLAFGLFAAIGASLLFPPCLEKTLWPPFLFVLILLFVCAAAVFIPFACLS